MATLLMRPAEGGSADKKRRARKGKNAQKKQPQRGLGVAQLEKLRLQEQSLLCPSSPSYSLRLCATPSDHPMARCDSDMSQTILSLRTSNAHAQAGGGGFSSSLARGGEAGVMSHLSTLSGHSTTQSCLSPPVVQDVHNGNSEAVDAAKHASASRALACLGQASKFSSVNASFFSNVLTATQLQILDSQAQAQQKKVEERRATAAGDRIGNAPAYIFPTINNYVKEAAGSHVNGAGFKPRSMFKDHVQTRIPLTLTDPHYLETLIGTDVPHVPRTRMELPVVGVSPYIDRTNSTKELSSFQRYPSQQAWSNPDKVLGRKRPWLALQESEREACHARALDLNAPAGESDAGQNERCSPARPNKVPENRVGAHYTTGIVRSALGKSCLPLGAKIKACSSASHWQDSDSPSTVGAYFSDMGVNPENGIEFRQCLSQSSVKDSCSSATGSSTYLTLNRQRCLNDPELPSSLAEKESICSNFLTLGISSTSYPDRHGWSEPEESIQDNSLMSMNDVSRLKLQEPTTSDCEGDNHAPQVRKSVSINGYHASQEVGVDLEGGPSKSYSLGDCGGNQRKSSMLLRDSHFALSSHYSTMFPSLPPKSLARNILDESPSDHDPSTKSAKIIVEDILDLSLKLAL